MVSWFSDYGKEWNLKEFFQQPIEAFQRFPIPVRGKYVHFLNGVRVQTCESTWRVVVIPQNWLIGNRREKGTYGGQPANSR
jgi:hypothetical protein